MTDSQPCRKRRIAILAFMALATLFGMRGQTFMMDDHKLLSIAVEKGWSLSAHLFSVYEITHYAPFASLLFLAEHTLFGERVFLYGVVSVAMHLGSAWAIGLIADHFGGRRAGDLAAACFFGLFCHYEITAWISAANYGGAAFLFASWGILTYLRAGRRNLLASLSLYILALCCKEDALAFLPILVALEAARSGWSTMPKNRGVQIFYAAAGAVTVVYLELARERFFHGWYVTEKVVVPGASSLWIVNLLTYTGVLIASFLLPIATLRVLPLPLLGLALLVGTILRYRSWNTLGRWGALWIAAGLLPFLTFTIPWQSRYTVFAAGGFALLAAAWPKESWARKTVLAVLIAGSFVCRLAAADRMDRWHRLNDRHDRNAAEAVADYFTPPAPPRP